MNLPKKMALGLIRFYRSHISPLKPPSCRFHPTCSIYAEQAISRFGFRKGVLLSMKRLAKCHPFHRDKTMICDSVPEVESENKG